MIPFGLVFIVMAIYAAVYNHHNATFKDRYSFFIVDEDEEVHIPLQRENNSA